MSVRVARGRNDTRGGKHRPAAFLLALPLIFTLTATLLTAPAALAHALFVSARPASGTKLVEPPATVQIVFTEPLNGPLSGIELYDSSGQRIVPTGGRVDPTDGRAYVLGLPLLSADRYTVLWYTTSLADGHTRRGSYTFTVLRPDGTAPAIGSAFINAPKSLEIPGWASGAAKWLALLGLFSITGPVLMRLLVPEDASGGAFVRPLFAVLMAAGIALLLLGSVGQLAAVWLSAGRWSAAADIFRSGFGLWWLLRVGAALSLALSGSLTPGRPPRGRSLEAWLDRILVVMIVTTFAATSHGAASVRADWGQAFDLVHLLAAGIWIGGIIALALVFLLNPQTESQHVYRCTLLQRFSVAAGMAVPAVLLSGVGSGLIELGSIRDFIASAYGTSLLIKLGIVALLLGVAAANALLLRPAFQSGRAAARRIRWTILAEALLGIAVLVPAAAMSVQAPARSEDQTRAVARRLAASDNPESQFSGNTQIGDQAVEVTLTPAAIGVNQFHVELDGAVRTPSLVLSLIGPGGERASATLRRRGMERQEDGTTHTVYETATRLEGAPGTWRATLRLPDGSSSGAALIIPLSPATGGKPASGPPGPSNDWFAIVAFALGAAVLLAANRALPHGRLRVGVRNLGGAGVVIAMLAAIALAAGGPTRSSEARPNAGTSPRAAGAPSREGAWGTSTTVRPRTLPADVRLWAIPTPKGGLMPPAAGRDGSVWVSEMDTNKLARLQPKDNTIQELDFGSSYKGTMGIAVDRNNIVWLAQGSASAVGRLDPRTGSYQEFPTPSAKSDPTAITVDNAGIIWLTELAADKIGRFDPTDTSYQEFPLPAPRSTPYWIAVAPDGKVWFTELAGRRIGVLDPATGQIVEYATPNDERPTGIAVDKGGTIWAGAFEGSVIRLSPDSGDLTQLKAPSGSIYGVTVGDDGAIWAGTTGATVYSLDPNIGRFEAHGLPENSGSWWTVSAGSAGVWAVLGRAEGNALVLFGTTPTSAGPG